MKSRKLFIGISAIVLVVCGIVATKATSRFVTYYYQKTSIVCSTVSIDWCDGGSFNCTAIINGGLYTVFTARTIDGRTCEFPAKRSTL